MSEASTGSRARLECRCSDWAELWIVAVTLPPAGKRFLEVGSEVSMDYAWGQGEEDGLGVKGKWMVTFEELCLDVGDFDLKLHEQCLVSKGMRGGVSVVGWRECDVGCGVNEA